MKKLFSIVALAAVVVACGVAQAASPCCSAETARNANTGKACNQASPSSTPGLSGCAEVDAGTCIGGTADPTKPGAPLGCVCVEGTCAVRMPSMNNMGVTAKATAAECTTAAVEGCVRGGAAH